MLRNVDLDKTVAVKNILYILDLYFPKRGTTTFENPEGFGGHYFEVENEDILNVETVVEHMIEMEESGWK